MIFAYSARDPMGRTVEGELDTASAEQAARELAGRALTVRWIRPVAPRRDAAASARPATAEWPSTTRPHQQEGATGTAFPTEVTTDADDEVARTEDVAGTPSGEARGGFSPWSVVLFLVFLSQLLRAC